MFSPQCAEINVTIKKQRLEDMGVHLFVDFTIQLDSESELFSAAVCVGVCWSLLRSVDVGLLQARLAKSESLRL